MALACVVRLQRRTGERMAIIGFARDLGRNKKPSQECPRGCRSMVAPGCDPWATDGERENSVVAAVHEGDVVRGEDQMMRDFHPQRKSDERRR